MHAQELEVSKLRCLILLHKEHAIDNAKNTGTCFGVSN